MRSFPKPLVVFLVLIGSANAYVGKWHSFTNMDRVTSLIAHQGFVYAGTQGGIRRFNPATLEEKDYDNLDGLLDCSIVGLTETGDGALWAVSKSGYLYTLSGNAWMAVGQSYAALQWNMNIRAVFASGEYIFLGSEKGLTVFDAVHQVAKANLTRFANQLDLSINSLLVKGDTLYVGTPQGVYKAGVNFENLFPSIPDPKFGNLSDPSIWMQSASSAANTPPQYDYLAFVGDALTSYGPGMILKSPVTVKVFSGQAAVIGTTSFPATTNLSSALAVNGKIFLGGDHGLSVSSNPLDINPTLSPLPRPSRFPRDTIANISVYQGKFWGQGAQGLYQLNPQNGDSLSLSDVAPYFGVPNTSLLDRHLRNLKAATNGSLYVGSWGGGLINYENTAKKITSSCIYNILPDFPVVYAVSNAFKDHLFFSMFKAESGADHQLVYLNTTTNSIACLDSSVQGGYPHVIHVFSDSLVGIGSDRGVVFMKLREGFSSPIPTSSQLWTLDGTANETWGLTEDHLGQAWALIGNQLAYAGRDTLESAFAHPGSVATKFNVVNGFSGTDCFVLENDPSGSLWAGCSNGLFQIETNSTGIAQTRHFGLTDGLLGLSITDISIDPANGHVWIATDHGINMLESAAQPPIATLQTVQVYPNPFRPQHRFVIFDNLPRDATVRIHTPAGMVVRIFHPKDLNGNQAQWDGTNETGKAVAAGVYLFSVTSGSSVERGKVIVAR